MAENKGLTFKGRPLMRKDNLIYYGSMADSHIVLLQILDYKKVGDTDVANKVSIQLQLTDPNIKGRAQIVKKTEKVGLYTALDVAFDRECFAGEKLRLVGSEEGETRFVCIRKENGDLSFSARFGKEKAE